MPRGSYVNVGAAEYGHVCPTCASPKSPQALQCQDCYDGQRARTDDAAGRPTGRYDLCACGRRKQRAASRCWTCYCAERKRGAAGPRGRRQPANHPWRKWRHV